MAGHLNPFFRQGALDRGTPLPPIFFILCMEVLGALISKKCNAKLWTPLKASQGGEAFSHLFFANEIVLFTKADRKNCMVVKDVLDTFCSLSGQKVSYGKSRVFFSPNIAPDLRSEFADTLGFCSTPSLGKYLGFPIKYTGINQDFSFIIEQIQSRMAEWKANLLSFTGMVVLT